MYVLNSQHLENIEKSYLLISKIIHGHINMIENKIIFINNKNIISTKLNLKIIKCVSQ